ncbi:MAG: DUF3488 and transglutaminase-like domain-containing protein [Chloroflexota bacterium]|nr:DUF3488 and transglutaminase-like domain-containing protein [Chloroflexota bacterium]
MPEWLRRYLRPREGWIAYFLLFVMLLSLGWSVQHAGWLRQEEFITPVALWASLLGALLGLSGLSVVATLPIAALVGTGVVLWTIGGEYYPALSQGDRLFALRFDTIEWTRAVSHLGYPNSLSPYAVGLAVLMWVTAFIAAYTLYRHHRVLDAILLVGAALIANMSATYIDLFGYLVLFVLAALLLWLRGALMTREDGWRRRRVNENAEVPASIMRTGVGFIVISIALSWALTSVAVAAPLTDTWRSLDGIWTGVRDRLDGFFGGLTNSNSRFTGSTFGSTFTVNGSWISNNSPVMIVASDKPYYMRTTTYDRYTGHGWTTSDGTDADVAINGVLFPNGTPEAPLTKDGFVVEQVTVKLDKPAGRNLFTPGFPLKISAPSKVTQPAGLPFIGALSSQNGIDEGQAYAVTAVISNVTEAQLRAASVAYPDSVKRLYLGTDGLTSRTASLASRIISQAHATNPYDKANALADWLRTQPGFRYSTDVGQPPQDQDLVDFFLFDSKAGYCQYYASAMVMMARAAGIPARAAVGFSPGALITKGRYQYRESNAHAWAEVYFPGYGWQTFEATKSINPGFSRLPGVAGQPVPSLPPGANGSGLPDIFGQPADKINPLEGAQPINGGTLPGGPNAPAGGGDARGGSLLVILAILFVAVAAIWWRLRRSGRRIRFLAPGDRQWALLLQAADRAGVSQRPSETDYEYAGWLEEQIPARRPEIRTIADAKVWGSYSGRGMTSDVIESMQGAWQRLRLPMVWLALRRRLKSMMPRRRPA